MNKLSIQKRAQLLGMLVAGNSLRVATRMSGCSINTITKLLVDVGTACADYQNKTLRNLPCKRIQCDEIWSFCYAKEKNVEPEFKRKLGYGDVYTWTAMCTDTKIVPFFIVGMRDSEYGNAFMLDHVQHTTDGHKVYLNAVEHAFGSEIDYAILVKIYGKPNFEDEQRDSPVECTGAELVPIMGTPDEKHISTRYVERQNLTMRMSMRRVTRLTNGFSKKIDNLYYAVALHFMHYNFGRIHKNLRVTPAMEAGVSDHVWSLEEIAMLADSI